MVFEKKFTSYDKNKRTALLALVLFVLISYLPSLTYPFIWDDIGQIVQNNSLRQSFSIKNILLSPQFDIGGGVLTGAFYRPLISLWYYLNYQLWGLHPTGFRVLQLILHLANTLLVYFLVKKITSSQPTLPRNAIALLAALLFAIHPVKIESVVYIGSIGEVLYTFLSLTALYVLTTTNNLKRWTVYFFFFALVFFGILAKESGITIVIIGFLYLLLFHKALATKKIFLVYAMAGGTVVAAYLLLRLKIASVPFDLHYNSPISEASFDERLVTLPHVLVAYLSNLLVPLQQIIYQNEVIHTVGDSRFWISIVALFFVLIGVLFLMLNSASKKIYLFWATWYCVGLIPVLSILPSDMTMADRWLYFPSIGFWAAIITFLAEKKFFSSKFFLIVCTIYLVMLNLKFHARQLQWKSDEALYSHDIQYNDASYELYNSYALVLMKKGELVEAVDYLHRALELNPRWDVGHTNLGVIYQKLRLYQEAEQEYLLVGKLYHTPIAYANLATLYMETNELDRANIVLTEGIQLYPDYNRLKFLNAVMHMKQGDREAVRKILTPLLQNDIVDSDIKELLLLPEARKLYTDPETQKYIYY